MTRRHGWIVAAGVLAAAAAITLVALPRKVEWSTRSGAALEEFERATEARTKLYHLDAIGHLERAIELDPEFLFAKLLLADELAKHRDIERAEQLYSEVIRSDLSGLRPRERFLIERQRAMNEGRYADATQLTWDFYEQYPDDPYVIDAMAIDAQYRGDVDEAERLYRHLLEVAPNWVTAYNSLGYITMGQGRFAEAEEYFTSYRFIAADHANSHDSLAELYLIRGRYEDAETSTERAIDLRSDFLDSYPHLILSRIMMRDFEGAYEAADRWSSQEGAGEREVAAWRCTIETAELDFFRARSDLLARASSSCLDWVHPSSYVAIAIHQAACQEGDWETAFRLEDRLEQHLDRARRGGLGRSMDEAWPSLLYMQGVRLALQGELEHAEKKFRSADGQLNFRESGLGLFKLRTRLLLVETLLAQGEDAAAHELLARVESANPALAEEFVDDGLQLLGLDRG
jgi:tetratricopeptide (TPR) repeat protein